MPEVTISPINKRSTLVLLTGILIALVYYQAMIFVIFHWFKSSVISLNLHYLLIASEVLVLYLYAERVERMPFLRWQEVPRKVIFWVVSITVLFVLECAGRAISNVPQRLGWHELWHVRMSNSAIRIMINWNKQNLVFLIFSWTIWAAAIDLIFRGYLLPRLVVLFKSNTAGVIASSLCFALFPFIHYGWSELIDYFITGVLLGMFYLKYRNIKIVIIARVLMYLTSMYFDHLTVLRLSPYLLRLH